MDLVCGGDCAEKESISLRNLGKHYGNHSHTAIISVCQNVAMSTSSSWQNHLL